MHVGVPGVAMAAFVDTTTFVVGDAGGRLRTIASWVTLSVVDAYDGPVLSVAASPGTGRVASLGESGRIRLWAVPGLEPLREWTAPGTEVRSIAFDPTGTRLASGGTDGLVRIWDPETGTLVDSLACPASGVIQLALQPSGLLVAAATVGGAVVLLDPARSAPDTLLANGDAGLSVAFSRDGERLAVGSHDQMIYLFDVARRSPILRLHGHIARVSAVHFLPDGRTLLSASHDGTIRLWDSH
jgi:WD40 repeat protein